jgi:hypothetical protein
MVVNHNIHVDLGMMLSLITFSLALTECHFFEITIDVEPNVLNIQSSGQVVTVHADIAYGV